MPFVLREINLGRWYEEEWASGELQAEALRDLCPRGNELSFWRIEDNRCNLGRIVAALAAGRSNLQNFDYALFDYTQLTNLGITTASEPGVTGDAEANQCHLIASNLTVSQLVRIAEVIRQSTRDRYQERQVAAFIHESVQLKRLDAGVFKPNLAHTLQKYPPK